MTSKLFVKIIASYIILCAIPLITGLVAYENAVSSAEKQTVRLTGAALQRAAAMTDNAIGEIESMTAGLAVNPNITSMVSSCPISQEATAHSNMQNAYKTLKNNRAISGNLLDIMLYSSRSDTMITSTHIFISLDRYYNVFFRYDGMDANAWRDYMLNDAHYTRYFPTRRVIMRTGTEEATVKIHDAILYTRSVRTMSGMGKLIAVMPLESVTAALEEILETYTDGSVLVYDATGQELAALGDVSEEVRSLAWDAAYSDGDSGATLSTSLGSRFIVVSQSKNGWRFVAALSPDQIFGDINYLKLAVYVMLGVEIVMLVILAILFARRYFKPVRGLVELVGDDDAGAQGVGRPGNASEYDYLRQMITLMKNNCVAANSRLDAQSQMLGRQLLASRLRGDTPERVLRESFERAQQRYPEDDAAVALIMVETGDGGDTQGDMTRLLLIEQLAGLPHAAAASTRLDEERWAVVFFCGEGEQRALLAGLMQAFADASCPPPRITICPSDSSHTLCERYKYADMRVHRWDAEPGAIDRVDSYEQLRSISVHYSVKSEERIIRLTKSGSTAELKAALDGVVDKNRACLREDPSVATRLMCAFHMTCARIQREAHFTPAAGERDIVNVEPSSVIRADSPLEDFYAWCMRAAEQIERQRKAAGNRRAIEPICEFIDANYADKQLSLTVVAEKFGLSETYLSRLLKAQKGVNYSEYLERLRINRACELLSEGRSVEVTADQTGYNSVTVFRAAFKRICGVNPSEFKAGGSSASASKTFE